MKNSFILHHDTLSVIDELTDEQAGKIIKEIYQFSIYLNNPKEANKPNGLNGLLNSVAHPFKMQLTRDLEKYLKTCEKNSNNGKKGGRPKKEVEVKKPIKAKKADSDKDSDSDKDNKKVKDKLLSEYISFTKTISESEIKIIEDFILYRKSIKKPLKTISPLKTYWKVIKELHTLKYNIKDCIEFMKSKEWQTISLEYLENSKIKPIKEVSENESYLKGHTVA